MPDARDPAAVFARTHHLGDGVRVRLRLARAGDQRPLAALIERLGFAPSELELLDLLRFDPHRRALICATALVGASEQIIGFGAIDLDSSHAPATVVVDPLHERAVTPLVRQALQARSQLRTAA